MPITTTTGLALKELSYLVPGYGIGLNFNFFSPTVANLYSSHRSGNCYVPVTDGTEQIMLEFAPDPSDGMSLNLATTGAGALDTGTVQPYTFYGVRVISKRGSSPALLAHANGKAPSTGKWQATFTFSGVPADGCTLTLVDNAPSPVTKVYEMDEAGSGGAGSNIEVDPSAYGGSVASALAGVINQSGFGITASAAGIDGKITLFHTYSGTPDTTTISKTDVTPGDWDGSTSINIPAAFTALPAFTLPAGYTHYSDLVFGLSCRDGGSIMGFVNIAPGECKYALGHAGSVGAPGIQAAVAAYTTGTDTRAINLSYMVPDPVARGAATTGTALASARAVCTDTSADIDCDIYWSADGRSQYDPNDEEGLNTIYSFKNLGASASGSSGEVFAEFEIPLSVSETTIAGGYTIPSYGRTDNMLLYKFSAAEDGRGLDVWIKGWKLNG